MIASAMLAIRIAVEVPRTCTHAIDQPRLRVTAAEQQLARQVIEHVIARAGGSDDLRRLLLLVAERESSLQPGIVHRLPADLAASRAAWRHTRDLYPDNPTAGVARLWQTYGLFGMNSSYFLRVWDQAADPRVLCDAVIDVLVYRRSLVRMFRRLVRPVSCGDRLVRVRPTWAALHGAVSGGKLCPGPARDFRRRAARAGLDPDRVVRLVELGREPAASVLGEPWSTQYEVLRGLWAEILSE